MNVSDALAKFGVPYRARLTEPKTLVSICSLIDERWPDLTIRQPAELLKIAIEYEDRFVTGNWSGALQGDVAALMRAAAAGRLIAYPRLTQFLIAEAAITSRKGLLGALCEGYLDGWSPGSPVTKKVASFISDRRAELPAPWLKLINECPELCDWEIGHRKVGERMVQSEDAYNWLLEIGLRSPHGTGFCASLQEEFLKAQPRLTEQRDVERLTNWVTPKKGAMLQGDALVCCLRLLLEPWLRSTPPDGLKRQLSYWFINNFGDPRFQQPEIWNRIGQDYRSVMMRWLAGDSIRAFMDIISAVEPRETWAERRRFWMSLFEAKVIEEAWVALHPEAARLAQSKFAETNDESFRAYGKQSGGRKDTSLLIMRAGRTIIVEGSHTYRVHVFDQGFPNRPRLYESNYRDEEITLPGDDRYNTNWHDPAGNWRDWVRRRLK